MLYIQIIGEIRLTHATILRSRFHHHLTFIIHLRNASFQECSSQFAEKIAHYPISQWIQISTIFNPYHTFSCFKIKAGLIVFPSWLKTGNVEMFDCESTWLSPADYASMLQLLKSTSTSNFRWAPGSIELNEKIWELWGDYGSIWPPILP